MKANANTVCFTLNGLALLINHTAHSQSTLISSLIDWGNNKRLYGSLLSCRDVIAISFTDT